MVPPSRRGVHTHVMDFVKSLQNGVSPTNQDGFLYAPTSTDPILKRLFDEEYRTIDFTLAGYNYLGPGTKTATNLINKVKPTDHLDRAALLHDIDYAIAADNRDKAIADRDFLDAINDQIYPNTTMARFVTKVIESTASLNSADYRPVNIVGYKQLTDQYRKTDPEFKETQLMKSKFYGDNYGKALKDMEKVLHLPN